MKPNSLFFLERRITPASASVDANNHILSIIQKTKQNHSEASKLNKSAQKINKPKQTKSTNLRIVIPKSEFRATTFNKAQQGHDAYSIRASTLHGQGSCALRVAKEGGRTGAPIVLRCDIFHVLLIERAVH